MHVYAHATTFFLLSHIHTHEHLKKKRTHTSVHTPQVQHGSQFRRRPLLEGTTLIAVAINAVVSMFDFWAADVCFASAMMAATMCIFGALIPSAFMTLFVWMFGVT